MTDRPLLVTTSPHIRHPRSTTAVMLDVILSLLPATVAGVWLFGLRALAVVLIGVASAVGSEALFCLLAKKKQTVGDLSAAVTGLLLALSLPANVPLWQVVLGAVFSIVLVKCVFGGIGQNFANPAITGRIFMLIAFGSMAKAAYPVSVDAVSTATPLVMLAEADTAPRLLDLFLGRHGGAIGETCILALLIGFVYLLVRRVISWHTPVIYVGTSFLFTLCLCGFDPSTALAWTLSGSLIMGAVFMATDYTTSPTTELGKVVFSVGAGLLTVAIRFFGTYPEGVSFAILFMNILTPYLNQWTRRRPFGGGKQ